MSPLLERLPPSKGIILKDPRRHSARSCFPRQPTLHSSKRDTMIKFVSVYDWHGVKIWLVCHFLYLTPASFFLCLFFLCGFHSGIAGHPYAGMLARASVLLGYLPARHNNNQNATTLTQNESLLSAPTAAAMPTCTIRTGRNNDAAGLHRRASSQCVRLS